MKLITHMDTVYRLSDRNYRRLLRAIAAAEPFTVSAYGRDLGTIDKNISDMEPDEAQGTLNDLDEEN
jgi:hypothetical protein